MYKSRQCTYRYSNANQVWGNGQWFQRANNDTTGTNFSNERTCLSIDEDDTDTDFSRSKQQWRDPLVALLMVTKQDADKINSEYKNNIPLKQDDSVCTHTPSKFEATDNSNKQMTIQISNSSYKQTTLKRATCFGSLDGIKDADKFNS